MVGTAVESELALLLRHAKRDVSQELLQGELDRIKREKLSSSAPAAPQPRPPPAAPQPVKVTTETPSTSIRFGSFSRYSWDQSAKWVKVYLTVDGLEGVCDEKISAIFEDEALRLEIVGLGVMPHNRRLALSVLGGRVLPDDCRWIRKPPDTILLKMRKATDGEEWASLDNSAAKKAKEHQEKVEANKGKSTAELLSQMYAEADEDGKAALSKAWEEGREKREAKKKGL